MKEGQKMNEVEQAKALMGGGEAPAKDAGENWEAKYKELEHQLQSAKVEQGRVKALDSRNKELEKELARLKESEAAKKIVDSLAPEDRGDLPDEYLSPVAKVANLATETALANVNEELERLRNEREAEKAAAAERAAADFRSRIDGRFPGFRAAIAPGGDKEQAWASYLEHNAASVVSAFQSCDYNALVYHVERFYRDVLGIRPPEGNGTTAVPDPRTTGGTGAEILSDGKTYTQAQIDRMYDDIEAARSVEDFARVRELSAKLERIIREGRVK